MFIRLMAILALACFAGLGQKTQPLTNQSLIAPILIDGGSKPTCTAAIRGKIWRDSGGAGVADVTEICDKDSADVYAWGSLGSGSPSSLTKATTPEAEAGVEDSHYMTPAKVADAFAALCRTIVIPNSGAQTIDAATDTITADRTNVEVTPTSSLILTSTPTIADGVSGQWLLISNSSTSYTLTLQDESALPSTNLRLGGVNVVIGARGSLLLLWNATLGVWIRGDTAGSSGTGSSTEDIIFRALCQNTVAGANFSLPATNAPTQTCVTGANAGDPSTAATAWNYGTLSFAVNASAATAQSVQGAIWLPSTWTGTAIPLIAKWRTSAIAGDLMLQIQGQCVADGEVPGNFGTAATFTADTAKGTTLQWNDTAELSLTTSDVLSGCAANEMFLFRLFRDAEHASDTLAAAAELVTARFTITR